MQENGHKYLIELSECMGKVTVLMPIHFEQYCACRIRIIN